MRPEVHVLLHRCRYCGVEWSQLGDHKVGDCHECFTSKRGRRQIKGATADKHGVEIYPVDPVGS